jgi:hypothetical protein
MRVLHAETVLGQLPPVATGQLVGAAAQPSADVLALASLHIAHGLADEERFDMTGAGDFVGEISTLLSCMDPSDARLLSADARTALMACARVGAAYREATQPSYYRQYGVGAAQPEHPSDFNSVRRAINEFGGKLRTGSYADGMERANLEIVARRTLTTFGSALGVVCMDLAAAGSFSMNESARSSTARSLHAIGARFLLQYGS